MQDVLRYAGQSGHIFGPFVIAVTAALVINCLIFKLLRATSKRSRYLLEGTFARHCSWPVRWLLIVIAFQFVLPIIAVPENFRKIIIHLLGLFLIALLSWLVIRLTCVLEDFVVFRFDVSEKDNLRARKVHTQLRVMKRIVIVVVTIIAVSAMLMTFEKIRQLGTTIIASAGLAGLIIGLAAQRTIGTFIAGIQIALTQPIRVDDVVIVENEWGRIEEITLTYVVVKVWDLRRLIVPITYFIEKPFQNWTRTSSDILGTVYIYVDYTVPVDAIRDQLQHLLEKSQHWDRKVCVLQVTNTSEKAIELRALMSASDASSAWTLRCEIREGLLAFIKKNYPQALPKSRIELGNKQGQKKGTEDQ